LERPRGEKHGNSGVANSCESDGSRESGKKAFGNVPCAPFSLIAAGRHREENLYKPAGQAHSVTLAASQFCDAVLSGCKYAFAEIKRQPRDRQVNRWMGVENAAPAQAKSAGNEIDNRVSQRARGV